MTRVNAASMVTGRHPGGHGLAGNTLVIPRMGRPIGRSRRSLPSWAPVAASTGRALLAPTLGEMLAPHGLTFGTVVGGTSGNAYVQHPLADRVGGAILHPEFALPGEHHARVVARFGAWPPKRSPELGRIRRVADVLLDYLVPEVDPDVALVWFPEPDTSQHAAGVGPRPAVEAMPPPTPSWAASSGSWTAGGRRRTCSWCRTTGTRRSRAGSSSRRSCARPAFRREIGRAA